MPLRHRCLALLLWAPVTLSAQTLPLGIGASVPAAVPPAQLSAEVHCGQVPCTTTLVLQGTLEPGLVARVHQWVDAQPYRVTALRLDSIGGTIRPAVDLARYARSQQWDTEVGPGGRCLSACVYAFLGGVHRRVAPDAWIGIHAHQALPGSADDNPLAAQQVVRELFLHFQRMGAQPDLGLALLAVPPTQMCYVRPSCLPVLGLTTDPVPALTNRAACSAGGSAWAEDAQESDASPPHPSLCRPVDPLTQAPVPVKGDPGVGGAQ